MDSNTATFSYLKTWKYTTGFIPQIIDVNEVADLQYVPLDHKLKLGMASALIPGTVLGDFTFDISETLWNHYDITIDSYTAQTISYDVLGSTPVDVKLELISAEPYNFAYAFSFEANQF